MEEIKKKIAECITNSLDTDISVDEIYNKIEIPKDKKNGDFAYPCFNLAKIVRNSPVNIANSIKENIELPAEISKVEVVNGYLNFYTNSSNVVSSVLDTICKGKEKYGFKNIGNNQNVCIDYSSPNIAKPFHLGHLRTTIIGRAISNLYKELGYNTISINYLGDWGRQFGLVIEGYKRFKDEYDISKDPLHSLSDMYVRANNLAKDDEKVMDMARENFKKLEDGNEEYIKLWKYFRELSLKEYNKTYELLGCKFDSYKGEAYYNDKMQEVIDILDKKGVLVESQGAKVVMLGKDEPPCIIVKSNGSTIYATRDLAAILDRSRTYDYVKSIYVTSYEQIHHFKQLFEVAKYIVDEKYTKELVHVPYGMVRLKTGKMSTREGTVIYLQDLINDAIKKAYNVLEEKNANLENKDKVAKQVGIGALVFNDLKTNKIKDVVFDLDEILRFDGETGPYVQYTYVRTKSILNKANFDISNIDLEKIDYNLLKSEDEISLVKILDKFSDVIKRAAEEYEPSILTRYLIDVSSQFSRFYNNNQVIVDDEKIKIARCTLVYCTGVVIKKGLSILGIETPDKM